MKKWIWIVITIVIAASVGGYAYARHSQNEKLYNDSMQRASLQISNKNYIAAETSFTNALKRKPSDKKATRLLSQTQNYMAANDSFSDRDYNSAKDGYQSVVDTKNGNETLKDRSKGKLSTIKTIQENLKKYNKIYNQALNETGEGNYTQSNSTLDKILSDQTAKQSYYKSILNKAKQLRSKNNASLSGNTTTTPSSSSSTNEFESSTSNSSTQNNPNVAPNSSDSLTSSEKKAANAYKGSNEFTVNPKKNRINGQQITESQVNSARKEISAAGVDSNAMSDQDIKNIIKGAHDNHETIGQYVKARYK
ncbi:hypothetical protein [Lentilactobacillus hilgardii]|uniref:hypothetical protein n=1 Tax=Lentilactobacillus hilgardii TaxID=1588 RepID=UPI0021C34547|nr:hypothetical protein [Lentilactobacillus hilgardii]MCP9333622.1 hypothetical protein [Lentilactobacillus hilgardii]MCP9350187.1 hypothetical protein [Lentilactobacillus hilgardii]MCP9353063.1 hypothetical protein [Lentilactobacillus hilgardii]